MTGSENEEDTHPGYEDTTWSDGKLTITMQDVERKLAELRSPVISIPRTGHQRIRHTYTTVSLIRAPEQVASTYDRAMKLLDLKYPIIITKNNNKYDMILDA